MIGSKLDHYKIVEILGEGGMGIVYKSFDLQLERYVAIKILSPQSLNNFQFKERFKREARNQAKLNHPNIVPVYGFTEARGVLGIIMEYIEGETLESKINEGRLKLPEALDYLQQILQGVSFAHNKGFIHRDIKPSNIIIESGGTAKIMDFGISKSLFEEKGITRTGVKIGTLLYMSPEQIKAKDPTIQSDIYSIGITFYEMLYGKNPFDLGTEFEIMEAHLKKNPPKLSTLRGDITAEMDKIVNKSLQKTLEKRYKTCDEFLADVGGYIAGVEEKEEKNFKKGKTTSTRIRSTKVQERKRYLLIASGISFVVIVVVLVTYFVLQLFDNPGSESLITTQAQSGEYYTGNPSYRGESEWRIITVDPAVNFTSIKAVGGDYLYLTGEEGKVFYSSNSGELWNRLTGEMPEVNILGQFHFSKDKGFMTGEKGTVLSITDNQIKEVSTISDISIFDIYFTDKLTGYAAGSNGTIFKTRNGGTTWNKINTGVNNLLFSIFFVNDKIGFAAGWNGVLIKTKDGGESWKRAEKMGNNYFRSIYFINDKIGFIAGGSGSIYKTTDGGENWKELESVISNGIQSIKFIDESKGIAVSNKGEIIISKDGGSSWSKSPSGVFSALTDITITEKGYVYICGNNGKILVNKF